MIFNYKDWTSYVTLAIVVIGFITYVDTLKRWKWGYWSIDLIPIVVILLIWFLAFHMIRLNRLSDKVRELEVRKR